MQLSTTPRPRTLRELKQSGWVSKTVKQEIHDNFMRMLADGDELFPGIIGYDRHGHSGNQSGAVRQARHAVSGRKGAGQKPADAAAGAVSR